MTVLSLPYTHTGANGELVFERFLIVHPDYKLRILKKVLIHTYIFSVFIFPYLFLWVVALALPTEDPGGPPNSAQEGTFANLDGVYRYWAWAAVLVLFLSVPGRILFDVVMGCSTVTRIYELRLKVRTTQSATNDPEQPPSQEQQQAQDDARQLQQQLLVMCVKILTYVAVSVLLNLLIHVPPAGTMTPVFVTSVNLCVNVCYALLTYFCFGKRGRGCWRPSWERIIRRRRDAARPHFTRHPMFTTDRKKSKRRGKRNLRSSSSSSSSSGQGKSSSSSSAVFTSPPIKTSPFSPLQQWRESMMFQNTDEAPKMELYRLSEECNGGVSSGSESGQDETAAGGGGGPGGGARTGSGNVGSQANSETSEFYVLRETLLGWTSPRSLSTHGPGEELDVESGGGGEGVFTAEEECKDERRMRDASA